MKSNQKGFTAIEGLLIVIALSLVVGVGFYVMSVNKKDKKTETSISTSQNVEAKKLEEKEKNSDLYNGWNVYKNDKYKVTVKYPKNWKLEKHSVYEDYMTLVSSTENAESNVSIAFIKPEYEDLKTVWQKQSFGATNDLISSSNEPVNGYKAFIVQAKGISDKREGDFYADAYLIQHNNIVMEMQSAHSSAEMLKQISNSINFY